MTRMTLPAFFSHVGLFLPGDNKLAQMKALTESDRQWFADRAAIECQVEIIRPAA